MTASESAPSHRALRGVVLSGGIFATAALAVQVASPIEGTPAAPAVLNWIFVSLLLGSLFFQLREGEKEEQAASGYVLFLIVHLLLSAQPWKATTGPELASSIASILSSTWQSIAFVALLDAWGVLALGYLCGRSAMKIADHPDSVGVKVSAWIISGVIVLFGVRGVIGYASGNLSLLVS